MSTQLTRAQNQLTLVDRATYHVTRGQAEGGGSGSRYNPLNSPTGSGANPPVVVAAGDGRSWFSVGCDNGSSGGTARCNYDFFLATAGDDANNFDDARDDLALEFEVRLADISHANNCNFLRLVGRDRNGSNVSIVFRDRATTTRLFSSNGFDPDGDGVAESANIDFAGITQLAVDTTYSVRVLLTGDTATGVSAANGTLQVYVAPGSITDRRLLGGGDLTWTKVVDQADCMMAAVETLALEFNPTSSSVTTGTSPAAWYRCLWIGEASDLPTSVTDGSTSWFDMHENVVESFGMHYDGGAGRYVVRASAVVHHGVTPGGSSSEADLVVYPSEADYLADTNRVATAASGAIAESLGFVRATGESTASLEPATPYVVAFHVQCTDASYNGGAAYEFFSKPAYLMTPPAEGVEFSLPPVIEVTSCANEAKTCDLSDINSGRDRAVEGWADNRCRFLVELGDLNYMDEKLYAGKDGDWDGDNAGVPDGTQDAEGAETLQQMADSMAQNAHRFTALEEARFFAKFRAGDDHDRAVNDMSLVDMLKENRLTDGGTQIVPWRKRGASADNARYGFPMAVEWFDDIGGGDSPEYGQTPRDVANNLLENWREWGIPFAPQVASGLRFDASATNKYGSTKFAADDLGYYHTPMGNLHFLVLDTRGSLSRSTDFNEGTYTGTHTPSFFTFAKSWVESAIAAVTAPGLIICIPGYVQGYASGGTAKRNDNIGVYINDGNAAILAEAVEIFKDAIDANTNIRWAAVLVGDHHYCSLDRTVGNGFSTKLTIQLADGGAHANVQDVADLGDTGSDEDYLYLTSFGLEDGGGGIRSRTRLTVSNSSTGAGEVRLWDCNYPAGGASSLEEQITIAGVGTGAGDAAAVRRRRMLASGEMR